jgi:acyl carrier protein
MYSGSETRKGGSMASFRERVASVIYAVVSEVSGKSLDELSDDAEFIADLDVKSVGFVRIIGALEEEFDLEIRFMEFRRRRNIGRAIDYVVELQEG